MLPRLIFGLLLCSGLAQAQVVVVSSSGNCSGAQAPLFNPSTGLYDCGTITATSTPTTGTGLLTGGGVVWTGNLNFSVSPATYLIGGTQYSSALTAITLDAADGANPRIDIIAVDNTGTAIKITGTAATPPAAPSVDPTSQIGLTFVYVAALATTPSNFSTTNLYLENTEWTCTASANFNCASTNNPYAGSKDIEATTAVSGNNVTLVKPAAGTENLSAYSNLILYVRSKASWPGPKSVILSWLNGSTPVGTAVTLDDGRFGFSSSTTGSYQQITIPVGLFGTGGNLVTTLKIQVSGGGGSIGFYLDNIFLQTSGNLTPPPSNPLHSIDFTIDGGGSAIATGDLSLFVPVNFACSITRVDMTGTPSGSITVDVWKKAVAIPTAADKISASAPMTLSASQISLNGARTGWTTPVAIGDVFGFTVATSATVQIVHGVIWCQ